MDTTKPHHPPDHHHPPTPLYILIPPSPLFAAHWSFFIPHLLPYDHITKRHEESPTGRRIHVSGDRLHGFHLEIIRDYDPSKHRSLGNRKFHIASISTEYLEASDSTTSPGGHDSPAPVKDEEEGGGYVDNVPVDGLEEVCVEVPAPGPSLNSAQSVVAPGGKRAKTEVRDCQWWVKEVVRVLWERGMLERVGGLANGEEGKLPMDIVDGLPKH